MLADIRATSTGARNVIGVTSGPMRIERVSAAAIVSETYASNESC
jgi:hypothetical protein